MRIRMQSQCNRNANQKCKRNAPIPNPYPTHTVEQENKAPLSAKADAVKEAKKAINRSITFDPATFTLHGITEADRNQWRGYAPGVDVNAEIDAFLDYMQTHPEALQRTLKTGAWKAALNTRFRNAAKFGMAGNSRVGTPRPERLHPFYDNKGVEFASAKAMRQIAEDEARQAAEDARRQMEVQ